MTDWREDVSWRELISEALARNGESWGDILSITLTELEIDDVFDRGGGEVSGRPFTAWTRAHVYFPLVYDGLEWCGSAPRNPNDQALLHQGGKEDATR